MLAADIEMQSSLIAVVEVRETGAGREISRIRLDCTGGFEQASAGVVRALEHTTTRLVSRRESGHKSLCKFGHGMSVAHERSDAIGAEEDTTGEPR